MTSSRDLFLAMQAEEEARERYQQQQERYIQLYYLENYSENGNQIQDTAQQVQDRQKGR